MHIPTKVVLPLLAFVVLITHFGCGQTTQPKYTDDKPALIKAVHYFSSSWPKSFWEDFEQSQVDGDFARIKNDGFNTIILVIPWMGFEIGFEDGVSEPSSLYERLEWLLEKIEAAGLDYGLRVSFPHNFDPHNGITNWQLCTAIFTDSTIRDNWIRYISRIAKRVDRHRNNFRFAFFSWEDFFCPYARFPDMGESQRLTVAAQSGYQEWLIENFPMQLVRFLYLQTFESIAAVPIPERESLALWFLMKFVDHFLINQLVLPARQFLPELAMEVRVDRDPIKNNGETFWFRHDLAITDKQLRGSYWATYFGAQNRGETLTANEALANFERMLDEVSDHGKNINHIVEQFNFEDNTPGFVGTHARIATDELPRFLEGAAELLKQKSRGYGLWAYRDYADSAIYNNSFELGLRGWSSQGGVEVVTNDDGDQAVRMQAKSAISQTFVPFSRFAGLGTSKQLTFCANVKRLKEPAHISLLLNEALIGTIDVDETAQHCTTMDAQAIKQATVVFSVSSNVETQIDDLRLYSYVQVMNVYDENGQPGLLRDLITRLNTDWLSE